MDEAGIIDLMRGWELLGDAAGLMDDAAFVDLGVETAISTDMLVRGVHFLPSDLGRDVGRKVVAVNVSDMAACGARPRRIFLSASFERGLGGEWAEEFVRGFMEESERWGAALCGGDTVFTEGPATFSATILGEKGEGGFLRRSGMKAGDGLWVSGTLGDAAMGLRMLRDKACEGISASAKERLARRYGAPTPRVELGMELARRGLASAATDLSDGLAAGVEALCAASGCGARIYEAEAPKSEAAREALASEGDDWRDLPLSGGDDYELLASVPLGKEGGVAELGEELGLRLTRVGEATEGEGVEILDVRGCAREATGGWNPSF